jgi:hypothetical protein
MQRRLLSIALVKKLSSYSPTLCITSGPAVLARQAAALLAIW